MITNVDTESNQERFKNVEGIGLYKVNYEMDVVGADQRASFSAGIIAYTSEEAIQTLTDFLTKNIKGFKGMKIQEMGFEGLCHAMSEKVENAIINKALKMGKVLLPEDDAPEEKPKAKKAQQKRSIVPKD